MIQSIPLPTEESLSSESLQTCGRTIPVLSAPAGFDREEAWLLANLVRVAYNDYERFDHQDHLPSLLQIGDTLWLPAEAGHSIVTNFYLMHSQPDRLINEAEKQAIAQAKAFKVSAIFTYLSFNLDVPPRPEVDRFGFVLERDFSDKQKEIYFIFRGTMEPSEWFNDFQYRQIPFLTTSNGNRADAGEICMGFNKIYTDYRAGLQIDKPVLNKFSRWIDEGIRTRIINEHPQICQAHKMSIQETVKQSLEQVLQSTDQEISIHVAGHSLGAALATICALHASILCEEHHRTCPISLYTFASPRVGNPLFAHCCNQRLNAFRIANSEDVVPGIPPATLRVIGEEMSPDRHVDAVRKALAALTGGVSDDVFEHVGVPVYFTTQLGEISSNHNLGHTYCHPLSQ
ncbi:MAG: hypothetical protein RLZZ609_287 [Cyanobacteriota bacterium]|jgi:hypothetical protein